jgi:hypothetical protein
MRGSIGGWVVRDGDGSAVAGATGTVVHGEGTLPDLALETNREGWFAIDGLAAGNWVLRVFGPNGGTGVATVPVFENAVSDVTIRLDGLRRWLTATLSGIKDGSSDVASAGAFADVASGPSRGQIDGERAGSTAEDEMTANAPRRNMRAIERTESNRAGSVQGRVVRASSGAPVPDATVGFVRGSGPAPDMAPLTDALGRFVIDGLTPGSWLLRALGPEGEEGEAEVRVYDYAPAHVVIELEDRARTSGSILGRVVRKDTGAPVMLAEISVVRGAAPPWPDLGATSDSVGKFSMEGLVSGQWALRVLGPDGEMGEVEVYVHDDDAPTHVVVEVEETQLTPVVFRHWVHSREEDAGDLEVFRPEGFTFPPSFGRDGFEMRKDGRFVQDDVDPADGVVQVLGHWTAIGPERVSVSFDGAGREGYSFKIVAVDKSVLQVHREAPQVKPADCVRRPAMDEAQLQTFRTMPAATSFRLLDFEHAEVITLESFPPQFVLTVSGTKPCVNTHVELVPVIYIRQPEYWTIEVVGSLRGIGLPALAPYTVLIPLAGTIGTRGIEVAGATRSERFGIFPEANAESVE